MFILSILLVVSSVCVGKGEMFMRSVAAYDIAARMQYGGLSLKQAVSDAVHRGTSSSTVAPAQAAARGNIHIYFCTGFRNFRIYCCI